MVRISNSLRPFSFSHLGFYHDDIPVSCGKESKNMLWRVGLIMENIHPGAIYNLMGFGCGNHSRVLEKYNRDSILEIENVTSQTMG